MYHFDPYLGTPPMASVRLLCQSGHLKRRYCRKGPAIRKMISDLGLLGHFQRIVDLDAYSKSVATFASTSSMIGVGRVSTLRAWRAARSMTRG